VVFYIEDTMGIYCRKNYIIENDDWWAFTTLVEGGHQLTEEDLTESSILGNIPMLVYLIDKGLVQLEILRPYVHLLPIEYQTKVFLNNL